MWPKKRTAILVIHGIGEQSPFDTLDGFVRGLWPTLEANNPGSKITACHHVRNLDGWTENYVTLVKDGQEATAIDCFEYYWAHQTQRQIDAGEVFDWLVKTGVAAQKYYDEMSAEAVAYEQQGTEPFGKQYVIAGRPRFKKYWYLKRAGPAMRVAQVLISLLDPLVSRFPIVTKPIQFAMRLVGSVVKPFVVGYFGDVVIYTTTDIKSKHYEIRAKILEGSVKRVEWLMKSEKPEYGNIILAGHSLGSVIVYDTFNRINHALNVGQLPVSLNTKLTGFVSFGSPLDKTAFFLRERASNEQFIKKQIHAHYHSFKAKAPSPSWVPPKPVENAILPLLNHVRWLNFFDAKDPVSGPLDFYDIQAGDNRELKLDKGWGVAHVAYWDHGPMYEQIVRDLF